MYKSIFTLYPAIALLSILFTTNTDAGQSCRSDLKESSPASRFVYNQNGTVTDKETNITWMRCAVGQRWDGKTCIGTAKEFSWQEAKDAVAELNSDKFGDPDTWRIPLVPELASIVERKCFEPRVNLSVFPHTPAKQFWSAMEKKGSADLAYTLDFGKGSVTPNDKEFSGVIRLMKDGPNGKWWIMKKPSKQ